MKIATLSVGFADGFYPGWMRKQGPVLVNGRRTRFLGCCMDQAFIDVTGIPCEIGDKVIMVGRDGDEQITTWGGSLPSSMAICPRIEVQERTWVL